MKDLLKIRQLPLIKTTVFDYSVLFATLYVGGFTDSPILKILLGLIVARQFCAFGILFHEGAHNNISRNRKINDKVADWVYGAPLFFSIEAYRPLHARHHSHLLSDKDPDVRNYNDYPMTLKKFFTKKIAKDLSGVNYLKVITYFNFPKDKSKLFFKKMYLRKMPALRGCAWILGLLYWFASRGQPMDILYLWLLPMFCFVPAMIRVRIAIEHGGLSDKHEEHGAQGGTRSTVSFLAKVLICPNNIGYHIEHHLHPAVPYYNLPELNRRLQSSPEGSPVNIHYTLSTIFRELFVEAPAKEKNNSETHREPLRLILGSDHHELQEELSNAI